MVVDTTIYTFLPAKMIIDGEEMGTGILSITELGVEWTNDATPAVKLEANDIVTHWIELEPIMHIYILAHWKFDTSDDQEENGKSVDEDDDVFEFRFILREEDRITPVQKALKKLIAMHKNPKENKYLDSDDEDFEEMEPE